ncbi:hypothetical protein J2Z65_006956 [Paenibacillus aceris]|uniref:Uncharacterized protein n=1 Tax=Paenibacillus aceris TaxID=869555 RepID=A0ABS4I9T9_9BACL|nr:hypothetical protein [Paenibacillus aceris]
MQRISEEQIHLLLESIKDGTCTLKDNQMGVL